MRVCLLALDHPWRPRDGGPVRTRLLVEALGDLGHETSIAYVSEEPWRAPDVPDVTFRTVNTKPLGERAWTQPIRRYKRTVLPLTTMRGGMIPDLARHVDDLAPDVLVVSQLRAAPYARFAPSSVLWLDQADVWSQLLHQEIEARGGLSKLGARLQLRHIRQVEADWLTRAGVISAAGYED